MGVKLVSSSGGSVEINPPTTASNFTATMPAGTGTVAVQGISGVLVSGTAQASTSGTSIDFTSIPSWVKRITVMFNGVSTNGTSAFLAQIGSGSVNNSGYTSTGAQAYAGGAVVGFFTSSAGFVIGTNIAANIVYGTYVFTLVSGNTWVGSSSMTSGTSTNLMLISSGVSPNLSGTLDRVRITTVNGTDTFDAGTINILYE